MKSRVTIFLLLLLCTERIATAKNYGEYHTPSPGLCSRLVAYLKHLPLPQTYGDRAFLGLVALGLTGSVTMLSYLTIHTWHESALTKSSLNSVAHFAQLSPPIADPALRRKEAEKAAVLIRNILELSDRDKHTFDLLVWNMRKHAFLWHTAHGDALLTAPKPNITGDLLVRVLEEKLQTTAPTSAEQALGVNATSFKKESLPTLQADARRILDYPAFHNDRPEAYRQLVAEVLSGIETRALKRVHGDGTAFLSGVFGSQTSKRYEESVNSRFHKYHQGDAPDGAAYRLALENASPGQTVGEALSAAGLKLFVFEPSGITAFMGGGE